jgi:MFS family permease
MHASNDLSVDSGRGPDRTAVIQSIARGDPRLLFAALTVGHMSQGLTFTPFSSSLPQMAHDLGPHGAWVAQMTMALGSLGLLVGALGSGWILERTGTRRTLLGSIAVYAIAGSGGMVLRDPFMLLATRFVVGFASACMVTTCMWGIAAEYVGHKRARALGIANSMAPGMALVGMVMGGFLARLGGWPLTFALYPAFGLIAFIVAFRSLKQVRPKQIQTSEERAAFFIRLLPTFLLGALLFCVIFMGLTQFTFLLQEVGVRDPATRSLLISVATVITTLTSFAYGWVHQRLGVRGTLSLGLGCAAVSLAIMGFGSSATSAVLGNTLFGVFTGLTAPYLYHTVAERTDAFTRSRAVGTLNAFNFLGGFLNPVLLAPLGKAIGVHGSFQVVAGVMAVATIAALLFFRRRAHATG